MNQDAFIAPDDVPKPVINLIITPHKLSLLILLQYYVRSDPSTRSLKRDLAVYLVSYIKKKISFTKEQEPSLLQLTNDINQFNSLNTEDLIDFLFTKLNEFSSPDDIYDFLSSSADLLDVPLEEHELDDDSVRVAGNSFFGLFIRKILLSFRRMSFQQLSSLFTQTNAYRDLYIEQQPSENNSMDTSFRDDEMMEISTPIKTKSEIIIEKPLDLNLVPREIAREHLLKRYLSCLDSKDFEGSLDSLHRYFDFCVDLESSQADSQKNILPYSVLNLAVLHFYFEHYEKANEAILETVRVAQERGDNECLSYALYWLFQFSIRQINSPFRNQRQKLIQRCIARAKELNMNYLLYLSNISLSKYLLDHHLDNTKKIAPFQIWNPLEKTSSEQKSHLGLLGTAFMLRSNAWELFGNREMAQLYSQLPLEHFIDARTPDLTCFAYCKLALRASEEGFIAKAIELLIEANKYSKSREVHNQWLYMTTTVLFDWCLARGELKKAGKLCKLLKSFAKACKDTAMLLEAKYRFAQLLVRRGYRHEAFSYVNRQIKVCQQNKLQLVKFYILLADIHMEANTHMTGMQNLLTASSLSEKYFLQGLNSIVTVMISEIHLRLGNSQKAVSLVESVIPQILNHCTLESQSNMHLTLSKCKLACISEVPTKEKLKPALESLEKAKEGFKQLQMMHKILEVCSLQARLYNVVKDIKMRDIASKEFRNTHLLFEERKNQIGFPANFVIDNNTLLKELKNMTK